MANSNSPASFISSFNSVPIPFTAVFISSAAPLKSPLNTFIIAAPNWLILSFITSIAADTFAIATFILSIPALVLVKYVTNAPNANNKIPIPVDAIPALIVPNMILAAGPILPNAFLIPFKETPNIENCPIEPFIASACFF